MNLGNITNDTPTLVNGILGVVLIMKLMISGHPKGKPFFEEICVSIYTACWDDFNSK